MHSLSMMTTRALASAFDCSGYRSLLDIGGGSGAYDIDLCRHYENLSATVLDLPQVVAIAADNVARAGLAGRVATLGDDFFVALPAGHDLHLFSMIMHGWSKEKNKALLRRSYEALSPEGAVVISELLVNDEKSGPAPAALMSLNMLIETEGRNYTASEYAAWLKNARLGDIETVWLDAPGVNGAVIGHKRCARFTRRRV